MEGGRGGERKRGRELRLLKPRAKNESNFLCEFVHQLCKVFDRLLVSKAGKNIILDPCLWDRTRAEGFCMIQSCYRKS